MLPRWSGLEQEEWARYFKKLAALGKLAAGLAHELNNPAAAIESYSHMDRADRALHRRPRGHRGPACHPRAPRTVFRVALPLSVPLASDA
ncbi:hypothetical protein [Knoellia subterranea]|uniref:histidine kinase n=1 Tax=Knoellia subterranea KCTC 19937 TaxID=1385521 RepID=A0A0A0JQ96_9MICO|nr:hypothetical protein [Knoellia subterranea]KGN37771.1 hypothetical protein N803_11985 [Knoellia subterranea KCTC 19937]